MKLLITLCTYNERENIELLVPEIRQALPQADILVIDDASPDGTAGVVHRLRENDRGLHLIEREGKLGLGTATVAGFQFAVQQGYDRLINMDADFSHHPRHLQEVAASDDPYEVVIGSRYVKGGGVVHWPLPRRLMSIAINLYARIFLTLSPRDVSGSYRNLPVSRLAEVDWARSVSHGYAFQEEILYRLRRVNCRFREVPILFEDRRFGVTKINWTESWKAVRDIAKMGWENFFRKRS